MMTLLDIYTYISYIVAQFILFWNVFSSILIYFATPTTPYFHYHPSLPNPTTPCHPKILLGGRDISNP